MAKSSEYTILMQIAGKLDKSFVDATKSAQKHIGFFGTESGRTFLKFAVGATAVIGSTVAIGKALYDVGSEFDNAQDKIRIGTGATGEALEELMNNAKAVYGQVPATLDDTSTVIADYNTRLGITGNNLEKLSVQALQVSQALGEDVSTVVENSSKVFKNFNIAEDDMADSMDYIFKVSQSTGVGFNQLLSTMQTGGAQLQAMGYSFNESATLLGQFEKAGLDSSVMLMGLKTTAQKAGKDGFKSTGEAMLAYIEMVRNAKTDTEALNIASEKFGSRGASTFVKAIKDGTLNIKELQTQLESSGESIGNMAYDTYDLAEKFDMFKNRMAVALSPIANTVFDGVNATIEKLFPVIEGKVFPLLEKFQPLFGQILNLIEPIIDVIVEIIDAITPALQPIIDLVSALVMALEPLLAILKPIIELLAKGIGFIAGGIANGVNAITGAVNGNTSNDQSSGIPAMAEGGIVTSPTLAMIGEGGEPEAVVPLSKMGSNQSINYSPVFNFSGDVSNDRAKEIARISFDEFKKLYQRMVNENSRLAFATI